MEQTNPFTGAQVNQMAQEEYSALPDQVRHMVGAMLGDVSADTAAAVKSMAAMLVALIPTLQGTSKPTSKGVPLKASTLPVFDGKNPMQLYSFFQQAELHFHAHGENIDSSASLAKLSTYFQDGALQFVVSKLPDIATQGWLHFKTELLKHYGLFTNFQATVHALLNLCHEPQSNYADYVHTFNSLLAVIKHYRPSYDMELFSIIFRRGLPTSVQAVAAEFMGHDIFELQNHIAARIVRNPQLAKQTGVSSTNTGPTAMDLGFAKATTAKIHHVSHDVTEVAATAAVEEYDCEEFDEGFDGEYEGEINAGFTSKGKPYRGGYKLRGGARGGGSNSNRGGYQQRGGVQQRGGYQQRNTYSPRGGYQQRSGYNNAPRPATSQPPPPPRGKFTQDGRPICNHCGIPGHIERDCRKKKYGQGKVHMVQESVDVNTVNVEPFLAM